MLSAASACSCQRVRSSGRARKQATRRGARGVHRFAVPLLPACPPPHAVCVRVRVSALNILSDSHVPPPYVQPMRLMRCTGTRRR